MDGKFLLSVQDHTATVLLSRFCLWDSCAPFAGYKPENSLWRSLSSIPFLEINLQRLLFIQISSVSQFSVTCKTFFPFLDLRFVRFVLLMTTDSHDGKHNGSYISITLPELRKLLGLSDFYDVITVGAK